MIGYDPVVADVYGALRPFRVDPCPSCGVVDYEWMAPITPDSADVVDFPDPRTIGRWWRCSRCATGDAGVELWWPTGAGRGMIRAIAADVVRGARRSHVYLGPAMLVGPSTAGQETIVAHPALVAGGGRDMPRATAVGLQAGARIVQVAALVTPDEPGRRLEPADLGWLLGSADRWETTPEQAGDVRVLGVLAGLEEIGRRLRAAREPGELRVRGGVIPL